MFSQFHNKPCWEVRGSVLVKFSSIKLVDIVQESILTNQIWKAKSDKEEQLKIH